MPEELDSTRKIAYVLLPDDRSADSVYQLIRAELEGQHGFGVRRRKDFAETADPRRALSAIAYADLVVADITRMDVEVAVGLGAATAFHSVTQDGSGHGPRVIVIGGQGSVLPDDAAGVPFGRYDPADPGTAVLAVRALLAGHEAPLAVRRLTALDLQAAQAPARLADAAVEPLLPGEVTAEVPDVAAGLLVTLYIQYIGFIVGGELAASAGLPPFPDSSAERLDLIGHLRRRQGSPDAAAILQFLEDAIAQFESVSLAAGQQPADQPGSIQVATALLAQRRTDQQVNELARTLARIAARSPAPRTDIRYWPAGMKAVAKITRMIVSATTPASVGTMQRLLDGDGHLRSIATLGGAHFLGGAIAILADGATDAAGQLYGREGLRLAELTSQTPGQRVNPMTGTQLAKYTSGLRTMATREDAAFSVEHPFHFRVLLEVLSDENRRYPAESILNYQALRQLWGPDRVWDHFIWYRDQLPVVANFIENDLDNGRDLVFLQHYVSFGRTPHTSSFVRLDYDPNTYLADWPDGDDRSRTSWWPEPLAQISAEPIRNLPNSVCIALDAIDRQRMLGRIWRGEPAEGDLLWLAGELLTWNGRPFTDGALARMIWDSTRWASTGLPRLALAEIRTATWTIQLLRRRLESLVPAAAADWTRAVAGLPDADRRIAKELRAVLAVTCCYAQEYGTGPDDGIAGLERTLDILAGSRELTGDMGPWLGSKLAEFRRYLTAEARGLAHEIDSARPLAEA